MGQTLPITVQPIPEGNEAGHALPPNGGPHSWNTDEFADHPKEEIE